MVSDSAISAKPHHRHLPITQSIRDNGEDDLNHERSPLVRHMSMMSERARMTRSCAKANMQKRRLHIILVILPFLAFFLHSFWVSLVEVTIGNIVPIEDAIEYTVQVEDDIWVWFRVWGKRDGVPVLFVHGGPGNAVVDYHDGNKRFFDASECLVVEVDQRGTGNSQPSVRDDWRNMRYYLNISIDLIASDFEVIREYLGIDQWLVWGGSYGSTIGLNYAMRYPDSCLALILRGIYLDTKKELKEVYTLNAFEGDAKRSAEFNVLYSLAASYAEKAGEEELDPNDDVRLLRIYERMITSGDKFAIWNWHAFENNLMEEDPKNILNPNKIEKEDFPEAQSVAFFETRLWLHGSEENPSNLLERVDTLSKIPTWICQGFRDLVCPPENAQLLVNALYKHGVPVSAYFIQSGHEDTNPVMERCLKRSMKEFLHSISD